MGKEEGWKVAPSIITHFFLQSLIPSRTAFTDGTELQGALALF